MRIRFLLSAVFFCLLFSSCNTDSKQIESVAYGYLDAMGNYDFDRAEPFVTFETDSSTINIMRRMCKLCDPKALDENMPAEITIKGVKKIANDTALAYYHKSTPITQQDDSVCVVCVNGQWLVHQVILVDPSLLMFFESLQSKKSDMSQIQ